MLGSLAAGCGEQPFLPRPISSTSGRSSTPSSLPPAMVNGAAGVVVAPRGKPYAVMGFTVRGGKIVEIDILADPERLSQLDLSALDG
jgi:hypothetical protein